MFIWGYNLVNCKIFYSQIVKLSVSHVKCFTPKSSVKHFTLSVFLPKLSCTILPSHFLSSSLLLHLSTLSLTKPQPSHLPCPSCTTHLPRPSRIDDRCHLPTPNTIIDACIDAHPLTDATY